LAASMDPRKLYPLVHAFWGFRFRMLELNVGARQSQRVMFGLPAPLRVLPAKQAVRLEWTFDLVIFERAVRRDLLRDLCCIRFCSGAGRRSLGYGLREQPIPFPLKGLRTKRGGTTFGTTENDIRFGGFGPRV
jgi:hypothetical protein